MLLAIDVGNSHTVFGLFEGDRLQQHWRLATNPAATADDLAALLHPLFTMARIDPAAITGVIIASVVPPLSAALRSFSEKYLHCPPLVVDHTITSGLEVRTDQPAEVGADRLVNAVAAFQQYHTALIIVDFGTAITFDCVAADGAYLGGAIAPGLAISLEALGNRTAQLPRVDISRPPAAAIGTNTSDAIRAGILFGYAGLIEGLVKRIKAQMAPTEPRVIATGGMAALIAPYCEAIEEVDPMLTLTGLRILYEQHR